MARANFVQKAAKDNPKAGIKKGESYWWWQLYKRPKQYSKTCPRPSQLTGSAFKQAYYGLQERLEDLSIDSLEDLETELNDIAGEIRELGGEQRGSKENMPEGLQDGETGQLLEARADGMDEWADSIESIDYSPESITVDGDRYRCNDEGCDWTGDEYHDECPTCGKEGTIEDSDEYTDAVAARIQEIIEEARDSDPGVD